MSDKKILFISPFFYPEKISTGKWNSALVEALALNQVDIDVISSYPLYPNWKPERQDSLMDGINIIRGGDNIRYPKNAIPRRMVLEIWFAFFVFWKLIFNKTKFDIVIFIFPPVMVSIISTLYFRKKTKVIGIVHDLMGIMAKSTNNSLRKFVSKIMKNVEKFAFNQCNEIICLSESMRSEVVSSYGVNETKCSFFYPFITMREHTVSSNYLVDNFLNNKFHIVYSGALGEKQIPDDLIEIMEATVTSLDDVVFHIFSNGPEYERLKRQNTNLRIEFNDLVPEKALAELYHRSDLQIIPQAPGTGSGAFPSKLPNLIEAGVPVFLICDENSELDKLMNGRDCCCVSHSQKNKERLIELSKFISRVRNFDHNTCKEKNLELRTKVFSIEALVKHIME